MAKNVEYRGWRSVTVGLVLMGFITGTLIFVFSNKLSGDEWVTGVLGLLAGYIVRDGLTKAAEVYRDRRVK